MLEAQNAARARERPTLSEKGQAPKEGKLPVSRKKYEIVVIYEMLVAALLIRI